MSKGSISIFQWPCVLLAVLLSAPAAALSQTGEPSWVFLPSRPLFTTLIGDPREPGIGFIPYLSERGYEGSLGGNLEVLRWNSSPGLQWGLGLSAGLWTLTQNADLTGLLVDDWQVAPFLACRAGDLSFRLEFQSQNSNLGDSLEGSTFPFFGREDFNLAVSWDLSPYTRLYTGGGYKVWWEDFDPSESQVFLIAGLEAYSQPFSFLGPSNRLYGAYHFKFQDQAGGTFNHAVQLGLQFPGSTGHPPGFRVALLYDAGHSEFGEFYRQFDQHLGLGLFFDP